MSSEQVAGLLRQSSQQVRLVIARSVRESPATTATSTTANLKMNTTSSNIQRPSSISDSSIRTINNNTKSTAEPSASIITDNDGILNDSQNRMLIRTERLFESNHNLEKILDNLHEQVHIYFSY